jgi:preprotein translocase subunit SecD
VIEVVFTEAGGRRFADLTRRSIGRRLAVVVDGKLVVAPRIEAEIPGGKAVLSGRLTKRQATDLAAKINEAASR